MSKAIDAETKNNIVAIEKDSMRGKRGRLIGEVCNEGIIWTNFQTGEQYVERYEE